jgi:hypothetical protein
VSYGQVTTTRTPRPRVLVRVAPRLLGDALFEALRANEIDAVIATTDGSASAPVDHWFGIALVTGTSSDDLAADVVIVLDDAGSLLSVEPEGDEVQLAVGTEFEGLLALLRQLAGSLGEAR